MIPITVDRIVDGDTLVGTIHLPYEVDLRNQEIRALGYDAWESRRVQRTGSTAISDEELAKGKAARAFFESLIHSGPVFIEEGKNPWDSFGRALGKIFVKCLGVTIDVAKEMTDNGHTRLPQRITGPNDI